MDNAPQDSSCRRLEFDEEEDPTNHPVDDEKMDTLHLKLSKEMIPILGMEFETEDAAYKFYNAYALAAGFSIRRRSSHTHKDGTLLDKVYSCSCEGHRRPDKRDDVYKSHRAETRFGCSAKLRICWSQTGKYSIVKFIAEHNHNLASPSKTHLFRSHRNVSKSQAQQVDMADASGIPPKNAFEYMAREAGGREKLGFAHVDYKNYLRRKRSLKMEVGDTGGVLEYLQGMKVKDPGFFYAIQVDEDDLITNICWVDAKMMAAYEDFGDVVCFDTTYRKHKDGRPIALFVGVNHHKQTTIFGVALLYDETTQSFEWLFDTFSTAMGGKLPKTMLTDQDIAMSKALKSQWPHTYHRLCIWHIYQNAATHLSTYFSRYKDLARDFSNCIYDYEYEEDFLDAWSNMLDKYDLRDNEWLQRLFNIKKKWALVYGRDTFCADMTTTQRSESMNKLIKTYVSYKQDLRRFFENFERLLYNRRYDEMVADFKASHSKISLSFPVAILKHAASIYTPEVYRLVQEELCKAFDCHLEVCGEMGAVLKYMITPPGKRHIFVVSVDSTEDTICCNCRKFEFAGLLCCHILKVCSFKDIKEVPSKYILKRWTKNAKTGSNSSTSAILNAEVDPETTMGRQYKELCHLSTRLVTRSNEFEDGYTLVKEGLLNLIRELDSSSRKRPLQSRLQEYHRKESVPNNDMPLNDDCMTETVKGLKLKTKPGSQSSKRPRNALEIAQKKKEKIEAKCNSFPG